MTFIPKRINDLKIQEAELMESYSKLRKQIRLLDLPNEDKDAIESKLYLSALEIEDRIQKFIESFSDVKKTVGNI